MLLVAPPELRLLLQSQLVHQLGVGGAVFQEERIEGFTRERILVVQTVLGRHLDIRGRAACFSKRGDEAFPDRGRKPFGLSSKCGKYIGSKFLQCRF